MAIVGLLLCAYLIYPAFHAVHLEGFTAQTQSIALLKSVAPALEHDPALPLVSQFIYQTRSAVVDILASIYGVFPQAGDLAFKALVLASFVVVLVSSVLFARRWSNVSPWVAFVALILTPGIPETAFFFNDNIVSAAFATLALALISRDIHKVAWLLSGISFAIAVLSRIDAVFMLPMILGAVWFSQERWRDRWVAWTLICSSALCVLLASAILHGFSLLDAFSTAQKFILDLDDPTRWFWVRLLFFGLAALPLLLIGGWINLHRLRSERSTIGILTFIAYPVVLIALAPKVTEIRYIFPLLAPIVAMHAGLGLQWVYRQCVGPVSDRSRHGLAIAAVAAAFAMLVMLLPPTLVKILDGPRSALGRLWSVPRWIAWQGSVDQSMQRVAQLVRALDDGRLNVVLATHFNDEFFLRLRLMEAGFVPVATAARLAGCNGVSLLTKGASTVVHIRTAPAYRVAPIGAVHNAALQIASAYACRAIDAPGKTYITAVGAGFELIPEVYNFRADSFQGPATIAFADMRDRLTGRDLSMYRKYGLVIVRQLTSDEVSETVANARRYLAATASTPALNKNMTIEDYARYYHRVPGPTSQLLSNLKAAN